MFLKNKLVFSVVLVILIPTAFWLGVRIAAPKESTYEGELNAGSPEKFEFLSKQGSNQCGLIGGEIVSAMADSDRLQGSCCSPMDLHAYQEQVGGLKKYSKLNMVPKDPYDISVSLAKELLGYQEGIQLTEKEQGIYNEAVKMSAEGGPCCCRCWRWNAFEGQAKKLIRDESFTSEQIAELWGLEDGCGGSGHVSGHG